MDIFIVHNYSEKTQFIYSLLLIYLTSKKNEKLLIFSIYLRLKFSNVSLQLYFFSIIL